MLAPTYPPNNTTLARTAAGTVFTWPAAFGATSYDVYFQGALVANTPTNSINGGSGYSTNNIATLYGIGTQITWRVVPKNADGTATCPNNFTFSVGGNGAANALPLTEGVAIAGNQKPTNGYTNLNANWFGNDAWFKFTASDCAQKAEINFCLPASQASANIALQVRRASDNAVVYPPAASPTQYLNVSSGACFITSEFDYDWYNAHNTDPDYEDQYILNVPTFVAAPGETYYVIADAYADNYSFTMSYTEVIDNTDTDGDGIPDCADSCPELVGQIGDVCGPVNIVESNIINADCECERIVAPCTNDLAMEIRTDGNAVDITWEVLHNGGVVLSGGGANLPNNALFIESLCLPDACYTLRVMDAGGDGITGGGYVLRNAGLNGDRIIDNAGNFTSGSMSAISGGASAFCLPISTQKPIFVARDKMDWVNGEYFVCEPDQAVSDVWTNTTVGAPERANSGYQFWFFDPNGSYSFRRARYHSVSDNFGPADQYRACHMKINNWDAANQIPANVMMNVRVRTRVNGVYGEFGPAFRFMIDPVAAACPLTKLNDIPNQQYMSCNSTRNWGANNFVHARQVSGANLYQFRFRIAAENFVVARTSTKYFLQLNWAVSPLQAGKTYDVDVRASKDGGATWCTSGPSWGESCTVTITNQADNNSQDLSLLNISSEKLSIYPNPNTGEQLFIDLQGIEAGVEAVIVEIYDMTGKQIVARMIPTQGERMNTVLDLQGDLATGMYLVNITAGNKRYTERLVISN